MNQYVTGAIIKRLREERKMTQAELAQVLNVSDKAVSKWETGKGYPDITLVEPIAKALGISTIELLAGESISNRNRSFNML
ncbi:MAG: helix-turn-helix transcriptional regulator, partial [Dethiobacteria bacterium]